jgi:hypothetical protein
MINYYTYITEKKKPRSELKLATDRIVLKLKELKIEKDKLKKRYKEEVKNITKKINNAKDEKDILKSKRRKELSKKNESLDQLIHMRIKPSEDKPSIFQYTIYRLPNEDELNEFKKHPQLTAKDIVNGFGYTIVGRGIQSNKNIQMIKECIQLLINKYPEDNRYQEALELANKMKSYFNEKH